MKEWIVELCPEIAEWQAELIAEQAKREVAAEREACAKVCEEWSGWHGGTELIAKAIRARGQA